MLLRYRLFALSLALASVAPAAQLDLQLDQSVKLTLQGSHMLKAAQKEAEAARIQVQSARAVMLPRLSAEAGYHWVAEIPSIKLSPNAPPAQFGDHNNYSLGLQASWDLFGSLSSWRQLQTLQATAEAKDADAAYQAQGLKLRARLAYFQTQLAATKASLLAQSLVLAQSQAADLQLRLKAGTSSKIDALSASNEELNRRAQYRLAQADLAEALRELFSLSGEGAGADLSLPVPDAQGQSLPAQTGQPSLVVALDPSPKLFSALGAAGAKPLNLAHPRLRELQALVDVARRQADAAFADHWPKGSISYKESLDYPNGPVLEQVTQGTFSAGLSLPLYSFGAVSKHVDQQVALADAASERQASAGNDIRRDFEKSRDRLAALQAQRPLLEQRQEQAQALQELVYKAYKIGGSTYLEVQDSGLKALQAGLDLAVSDTQTLIELANLAALTDSEN
jgi:outer membrane protein TolC